MRDLVAHVSAHAAAELRVARRNRLALAATICMALFAAALAALGAGAAGALEVDALTVAAASLATLTVYLCPLIALLLAFDAVAGEVERGALGLILCAPAPRMALLGGKLLAHLAALAVAMGAGCAAAAAVAALSGEVAPAGLAALGRLWLGAMALGATFLGLGYALSARARGAAMAAGYAVGAWLIFVVLYDLALLAGLISDGGEGVFTRQVFPWLLLANPADAFRLAALPDGQAAELASGFAAAGAAAGAGPVVSLCLWPPLALGLAWLSFRRVEP